MLHALADILTSPLAVLILAALIVAVGAVEVAERRTAPHVHHFPKRHPSGVWACDSCPALRDRHGNVIR